MSTRDEEHSELARMACYCTECCGDLCPRPPGCLRDDIVEAIDDAVAEALKTRQRSPEWWATYNAAITGLLAGDGDLGIEFAHKIAVKHADMAQQGDS